MCAPLRISDLLPEAIARPANTAANVPVATDALNATTTSAPVSVTVNTGVVQAYYIHADHLDTPGSFTLTASASSATSTIAKVAFYNGTTLIGTATAAPYSFTWANVPVGTYSLTVVATDALNATTTSTPVSVTVNTGVVQAYYIHADQLDTPRQITDTNGAVVWQWDNLDPFGNNMANENPTGAGAFNFNLRFPGQYFDRETNTHYNINRDYDPSIGRYIESDPIGLMGGVNTYTYVGGNPLRWVDLLGLDATVTASPLAGGGFNFTATGSGLTGSITGTFNTGTTNFNQIQTGTYSVAPRPSLPDTFINELFNRDKNAGRPTISNTKDWNTIRNSDGSITHGAQIHPGKNGTNGGTSLGCMVTDQSTYGKLNKLFQDNYNNGGVKLIVLPAP